MRITRRKIIVISIVAIILGGWFVYAAIKDSQKTEYTRVAVRRGEVVQNVSVTGTVIPARQIDLQFETSGRIEAIAVKVSDEVENGQALIRLDTAELSAQLQSNQAALAMARAKLAKIVAGNRPEDIQVYRAAVDKAEVTVTNEEQALTDAQSDADNDLESAYEDAYDVLQTVYTELDAAISMTYVGMRREYFDGTTKIDLGVQERGTLAAESLSAAKTQLDAVSNDLDYDGIDSALDKMETAALSCRSAFSYLRSAMDDPSVDNEVASADETIVDTKRTTIDDQIVDLTSAQQTISSTEITNQTDINAAQADLNAAEAALQKAENELELAQAGPRQEDVDLAEAEVSQASANLQQVQEKINKKVLRAPVDGIVTAIEKEEGETAQANSVILSMIGAGRFQIEANVSETEIAKVSSADEATITLDALGSDEEFKGQIIGIDPAETVVSGVIYYKITSVFNVEDERIKSGMTANLDIHTAKKENVLYLPYYIIQQENGREYVKMISNGRIEERTVVIGLEGETHVEIISGLKEGDFVIFER